MAFKLKYPGDQPVDTTLREESAFHPVRGIMFRLHSGRHFFAPYSFLTSVDLPRENELVFRYTHSLVVVQSDQSRRFLPLIEAMTLRSLNEEGVEVLGNDHPRVQKIQISQAPPDSPGARA